MRIEEISGTQALAGLQREWMDLHGRSADATVYAAHEFAQTWWRHLGSLEGGCHQRSGGLGCNSVAEGLRILVAREGQRVVGLAPLQRLKVHLEGVPSPVRVLGLLGDLFLTRYRDLLVEPGREREFVDAVWAHLLRDDEHGWDAVLFGNLPEESPTARLSVAALQQRPGATRSVRFRSKVVGGPTPENLREVRADLLGLAESRQTPAGVRAALHALATRLSQAQQHDGAGQDLAAEALAAFATLEAQHPDQREALRGPARLLRDRLVDMEYPYVALPPTWEEYKAGLSYRTRRTLQGDANRLARAGQVSYECVEGDFDPQSDFDDLVRLHRGILGERSVTLNEQTLAMQRELLTCCAERGWLRLFFLCLDGRRVAALCCYDYQGRRYAALLGRDRDSPASPGILIITHAIEDAIARGLRELDFGPGHVRYKQHLSRHVRRVGNLLVKRERLPLSLHDLAMKVHGFAAAC